MIQQSTFAGKFYSNDKSELQNFMRQELQDKSLILPNPPKALIMPHAGFSFSGSIAGRAAREMRGKIEKIVILGPSHRFAFSGIAVPKSTKFETPLGNLDVDKNIVTSALALPFVEAIPEAFNNEHSIEVELPWIIEQFGTEPKIVPIVIGNTPSENVTQLIDALWGDEKTLIIISTDLSHFHEMSAANKLDAQTAFWIETSNAMPIDRQHACGWKPLQGFLASTQKRGMRLTRLALTNSGHITGDKGRVVGYGAWAVHDANKAEFGEMHRDILNKLAARSIQYYLQRGKEPNIALNTITFQLQTFAPSFITLEINNRLRGCIGSLVAHKPIGEDVSINAIKAAFKDPRFKPLSKEDFDKTDMQISILNPSHYMEFTSQQDLLSQLVPGEDGLILHFNKNRGTFLPKVWEGMSSPEMFFNALKRKAGLPEDFWDDEIKVQRYSAELLPKVKLKHLVPSNV